MKLKSLQTKSRLEFCQKFQEHMIRYDQEFDRSNFNGINIAVTELAFPRNYYTWNTENRTGVVVGINSLEYLFNEPLIMNKIIVRVIQRMLVYSLNIEGLKVHEDTRGCLFDLTRELREIQFSVDSFHPEIPRLLFAGLPPGLFRWKLQPDWWRDSRSLGVHQCFHHFFPVFGQITPTLFVPLE
jgi:hypothetical protein